MAVNMVKQILVDKFRFASFQVDLGLRAGFRCEYCGRDLLESAESYLQWQVEHIIPQSKGGCVDFTSDNENLALSCKSYKTCNFFKQGYLPEGLEGKSREKKIAIYKEYVKGKMVAKEPELVGK